MVVFSMQMNGSISLWPMGMPSLLLMFFLCGTLLPVQLVQASSEFQINESAIIRIVAIGTSLTANYRWPYELATQLSLTTSIRTEVEILAVPGQNSSNATNQWWRRGNKSPDIVLIEFATNDADMLDGVSLQESRENHLNLITTIRKEAPFAQVVLLTMNPVFGLRGWVRPALAEYNAMYKSLATKEGIGLVDFVPSWKALSALEDTEVLFPDGLHPRQEAASRIIVPMVLGRIGATLKTKPRRSGNVTH